ncbi:response regulator [Algihabitans albus]|uniref:response regulator n=1 Tax=Algihabitans albus TaxID=2164067 RepID=UPI000E5CE63A|nr:response regulator [Algihabitans albus]
MTKVLLIEDDDLVRATLREMLEDIGCTVLEAEDGSKGIALLAVEGPALVITDILMPNKEGTETIHEIRSANPDLPLIAISGGGVSGDLTFLGFAERLGANRVLQKPINFHELEACVNALLPTLVNSSLSSAAG